MPALAQDVTLWQGDTHVLTFKVDDGNNNPIDLTGATGRWWAAKKATSTGLDIFIEKGTAAHTMSFSFNGGDGFWYAIVPINPPDTQNIPPGKWYHESEIITQGGVVARGSIGKFNVNPSLIPASLG
jgi:hypothetical protein